MLMRLESKVVITEFNSIIMWRKLRTILAFEIQMLKLIW